MEAVRHGPPEGVVAVEDAPGGLQHRVEQAVAGRPVPQRVQPRAQPHSDLLAPVDDVRLRLQLLLGVAVQQLGVQLLLGRGGKVLDFCTEEWNLNEQSHILVQNFLV